jgi:DNA topoisomerase-2
MNLSDFLNEEMIKFSHSDCSRSLPHGIDGLKESQRKILYAVRKRNLKYQGTSLKVAQLSGYTAEHSNYHHGEQNLQDTIINMASGYPGTNNIPLLYPDGGFGTRLEGGKDAASARYIYTKMEAMTEYIFRSEDEPLLTQVNDDGDLVQPEYYVPIIPMILVNGCTAGIGTGWSCNIPCYNPKDLITCIKIWLENDGEILLENPDSNKVESILPELVPWYRGFNGEITSCDKDKFITKGVVNKLSSPQVYNVSELPIGMWTCKFKDMCEDLVADKKLKSVKNHSNVRDVNFTITKNTTGMPCNIESLKLTSFVYTSNMVLFTEESKLRKYENIDQIIDSFCIVRFHYYKLRKIYQIKMMEKDLKVLENKARFIDEVINEKLVIMNEKENTILNNLKKSNYDEDVEQGGYDYLLRLQVRTFTNEKVKQLNKDIENIQQKLSIIKNTSEKDMWINDLNEFEKHYDKWVVEMNNRNIKRTKK